MISADDFAQILGYTVMAAGGVTLIGAILFAAAVFTRRWAWRLWEEMATIYRIETMRYWFGQLKEKGWRVMRDAKENPEEKQP